MFPRIQVYSGAGEGRVRHEHGDIEVFRKGPDPAAVISVLVRDDDGRNPVRLDAAFSQAPGGFPAAQPDIHEYVRIPVTHQRGVSRAPAAKQFKA